MEQLAVMKQRIKSVETIKKVTHAMRLISMSSHTRLLEKKKNLTEYNETFKSLWASVQSILPPKKQEISQGTQRHLVIIIGSQKGLCGAFNTSLFKVVEQQNPKLRKNQYVIGVGHFAVEYLKRRKVTQLASYPTLNPDHFVSIAQAITELIVAGPFSYQTVSVYSNKEKTFFVQQPQKVEIFPLTSPEKVSTTDDEGFLFEQSPQLLRDTLQNLLLSVSLQDLLFESLLAEQAARFISMDASTRNADSLITTMKLGYNKVRQATITRELTELSATL